MLTRVANFYKSNKYVVLWTAGYCIVTWAIMKYMFNFDIFSSVRWWQLMHAHLHGFGGFVFGILILAAVPMYIATTMVIVRTKSPLFTIKIPQFIKNAFIQTPLVDETPTVDENQTCEPTTDTPSPEPIPETVPNELRVAYIRAREHVSRTPTSAFDLANVTGAPKPATTPNENEQIVDTPNEIPIPTDFDIDDTESIADNTIPQFTDINFDDDDTEIEIPDVNAISETTADVVKYLESKSIQYIIDGDVVISDKFAIVSHTDSEFWVADDAAWFAAGKTRQSPIELVKRVATEHNTQPVLYLGANNIMDIENLIPQWESDGIRVITDLKDLI